MSEPLYSVSPGIDVLPLRTPTLPPATHTNCVILGTSELVLIDPATPHEDERERLWQEIKRRRALGTSVRAVWLTHHHPDHVGAAAWLVARLAEHDGSSHIQVVGHPETARRLDPGLVTSFAEDGDLLTLGEQCFEVLHTPGHATGHLCLFERQSGVLLAGDMVASVGTIMIDPPEGHMATYLRSLERLKTLAPRVAVPAHGPPIETPLTPVAKFDEYIGHRLWREQRVLDAMGTDTHTAASLVAPVYRDIAPALFPLAERSLTAHLLKLKEDGRVSVDAGGAYRRV